MIDVLYQDNHVLVAVKPAGMPTQKTPNGQEGFEDLCKRWLQEQTGKPSVFLHVVHRLDSPVGGIVLMARTSKALSRLQESMRQNKLVKRYTAQVDNPPKQTQGVLRHYLFHDEKRFMALVVPQSHRNAKEAVLNYNVVATTVEYTTLEVELKTGRYHQIRAQLAAIGSPIIGDAKYGSQKRYKNGAIALWHTYLAFPHPTLDKIIEVSYKGTSDTRD